MAYPYRLKSEGLLMEVTHTPGLGRIETEEDRRKR